MSQCVSNRQDLSGQSSGHIISLLELQAKVQVNSLLSSLMIQQPPLPPPPSPRSLYLFIHTCAILTPRRAYSSAAVSEQCRPYLSHGLHFHPIKYSFTPESSEAFEGKVPCPKTQHRNNVPILHQLSGAGLKLHIRQRHWQSSTL